MATCFVIVPGEDGARVYQMTEAELTKKLNEGYWGDRKWMDRVPDGNNDPNYWRDGALIIRGGTAVVPKAVTKVTEYKL